MTLPDRACELVAGAGRIVALTGAGVSAESGIPTFRGPGGLFENHRPEELATPAAFAAQPERVWRFYRWRRDIVAGASPNPGHLALAEFSARRPLQLITQNVDGLHQRAGFERPVELHGNLMRSRCEQCDERTPGAEDDEGAVPRCRRCAGRLRPDVVWFGEALARADLEAAAAATRQADLFLVLGTSALVYPAAGYPLMALEKGCPVIEINPQQTALTEHVTVRLAGTTGEWLPRLLGVSEP